MFAPVCRLWVTRSFRFPLSLPVAASNTEWESHWGWSIFSPAVLLVCSLWYPSGAGSVREKENVSSLHLQSYLFSSLSDFLFEKCRSMSAFWKRPRYRVGKRRYQRRADQLGISGARDELLSISPSFKQACRGGNSKRPGARQVRSCFSCFHLLFSVMTAVLLDYETFVVNTDNVCVDILCSGRTVLMPVHSNRIVIM